MNKGITTIGNYKKLLIYVFGIFLVFSLLSFLILYKSNQMPVGQHYAAAHSIITQLRDMEDVLELCRSLPKDAQEKTVLITRLQELDAGIKETNQEVGI